MPRCRTREVMVPGGCREPAWGITYLEVLDLEVLDLEVLVLEVLDLEVLDLEVRAVSRSKRRLQIDAMPFRGHRRVPPGATRPL